MHKDESNVFPGHARDGKTEPKTGRITRYQDTVNSCLFIFSISWKVVSYEIMRKTCTWSTITVQTAKFESILTSIPDIHWIPFISTQCESLSASSVSLIESCRLSQCRLGLDGLLLHYSGHHYVTFFVWRSRRLQSIHALHYHAAIMQCSQILIQIWFLPWADYAKYVLSLLIHIHVIKKIVTTVAVWDL